MQSKNNDRKKSTFWTESQHYDVKIHKYEMQSRNNDIYY